MNDNYLIASRKNLNQEKEKQDQITQQLHIIEKQIDYHKNKEEIKNLKNDIINIQRDLQSLIGNEQDVQNFEQLEKSAMDARAHTASLLGEKKQLDESYQHSISEFNSMNEIPQSLNQARLKHHAIKLTITDLLNYEKTLDETLIEFHQRKMEEINKIIQKLWEDTYISHDLDSIFIKTSRSKSKNALYDYSVMMRKDGAEIEMHGRCSAGQKMLASLIIRLALAQAFSKNCGIIALDEPTTNLDNDNMNNFAEQLSKLVQRRAYEDNHGRFQMIIISHSESFVNSIAQYMDIDHFYQIIKEVDGEHHYSTIKRNDSSYLSLGQ